MDMMQALKAVSYTHLDVYKRQEVRYATALTELDGGQKLVRFYDPSGNLIEVRTPWDKFVNRE